MKAVEKIKKLSGHSGCEILLIRKNGCLEVRKISSSESYNQRLKNQCLKQIEGIKDNFNAPQVIDSGLTDENLFFFDMEFINCYSLGRVLPTMSYDDIKEIFKGLISKIDINEGNISNETNSIVKNKVKIIFDKIHETPGIKQDILIEGIQIVNETDFSKMPLSPCHGDLTLENILLSNKKNLYFIDFLDSYIDSWVIDVAKILQDLELHWSYRNLKMDANIELRTLIAKEQVLSEIRKKSMQPDLIINYIYLMLLVNVLRIFPYSSTKSEYDYLNKALIKVIRILNTFKQERN